MNDNEMPQFQSCKQYKTNSQVFEFIDITDSKNDIIELLNMLEADAAGINTDYAFEFIYEAYKRSYTNRKLDYYTRFKYELITTIYKFQIYEKLSEDLMLCMLSEKLKKSSKVMAAFSFYHMIFFGYEATLLMLKKIDGDVPTAMLNYFRYKLISSITTLMDDLWYIPHFKDKERKEMVVLQKLDDLKTKKVTLHYDSQAREILGILTPVVQIAPIIADRNIKTKPTERVRTTKRSISIDMSLGFSSTPKPKSHRTPKDNAAHFKKPRTGEKPYIISEAVRAKVIDTPQYIKKDTSIVVVEDIKNSRIGKNKHDESVAAVDISIRESDEFPKFQKYVCTSLLGSGSFSKVYGAVIPTEGNAKCAVKVLHYEKNQTKNSVENEIYIMKLMNKSGKSVVLMDSHINELGAIIVMEMALTDLKQFCEANYATADKFFILHYWGSMVACVRALHSEKIAHLDLKLQNFVITEDLHVKLIDFGISKQLSHDMSVVETQLAGTYVFMSPELLREESSVRPYKCDIWSLGIILFMLLFQRIPLQGIQGIDDFVDRMCNLSFLNDLPQCERNCALLNQLLFMCLRHDAKERPHASELLKTMKNWDE